VDTALRLGLFFGMEPRCWQALGSIWFGLRQLRRPSNTSIRPERFAMEHPFDEQIVIDCYLSVLERV
jgi:hypothetical protein